MADKGQQTEQPTARRLQKARREGRFFVSRDFISAVQFAAVVGAGVVMAPGVATSLQSVFRDSVGLAFHRGPVDVVDGMVRIVSHALLRPMATLAVCLMGSTIAAQLVLTRGGIATSRLAPDLNRLNFVNRARELPRQNLGALVQALVLLPLFAYVVYSIVQSNLVSLARLPLRSINAGTRQLADVLEGLLWQAAAALLAFGLIDLFRQRRRYMAELRMSRQEIRDEIKETEGNPEMRARVRRIQRDLLRRRMMQQVATATAVIVNPTHYAVAIRYEMDRMRAPEVVAKGKNYLAQRIRQRAIEHQVPIVENPPLAQALYRSVEIGQEIPPQLYRAVAEILAYIFRLMNRRPAR